MTYFNAQGQGRVGWKSGVIAPTPVTVSTLLTSLYSVWNGDTTSSTLDSSIYGAWNGENNANDSVGTNHGTLMNGCTFTTGKIGQAFTFDGVNDYVSFPNNSLNSTVGNDFSISLWAYFTSTGNQALMSNLTNPSVNLYTGWDMRLTSGMPTFNMWNNSGSPVVVQGGVITTNTWYHIVVTRKKGSRTMMYINGSLIQSNTNTTDPSISSTYYPNIGHFQYLSTNGASTSTYHGMYMASGSKIDTFSVWNKELTSDEVTQLYNLGTGAQYPFSGQTLPSANNQFAIDNGTLMNGCTFTDGKIGKAFTFDGVNDYIKLPSNSLSFTSDFSVSFWMKLGSLGQTSYIIDSAGFGGIGTTGWVLNLSSGNLNFTIHNNNTLQSLTANYLLTSTSVWYHVVITSKSGYNAIYLNNSLITSNTSTMRPNYVSSSYNIPYIGVFKTANTQFFYGNIDSLTTWQKSLTQAEVTELYNSGAGKQLTVATPIVTNGLVLNLDASRLSSWPNTTYTVANQTWYDISGNGNNSTLINGPAFSSANGGMITFDGVNDYGTIPYTIQTQFTNKITLNAWVKPSWFDSGNGDGTSIITKNVSSLAAPFTIFSLVFVPDGSYGGYIGNGGARISLTSTNKVTLNTWVNICLTYDGSTIKLYKNGVQDPTTAACSYTLGRNTVPVTIASNQTLGNYYDWFKGDIGLIQMYNTGLSSTEILQNYNATKSRFGL